MDMLRQLAGSLLLALFSAALVVGGMSLALAESYVPVVPTPTETQIFIPFVASPTSAPPQALPATVTLPPTPTVTIPPPTTCPPPAGWVQIAVGPGDDLVTLSFRYQSTPEELLLANCLFSTELPAGSFIYVPPIATKTPVPCGPPFGWVRYTVQPGNTMYSLSQAYGVSISQLQFANCMAANQYNLSVGQSIWVPNVPTRTPHATATATLTPVSIVFPTITRTATPTQTGTPVFSPTPTPTRTGTGTVTATTLPPPTATPTATPTITAFPTQTSSP